MVTVTSRTGITKDLCLDFDAIVEMENADPKYSFFQDAASMSERPRLSTLDRMTRLVYNGHGWKDFVADGFTIKDLATVVEGSMKELGFTSEENPPED